MHKLKLFEKGIVFCLLILSLSSCSSFTLQGLLDIKKEKVDNNVIEEASQTTPPSQNRALNAISPSSTSNTKHSEDGVLQKETDAWLKNEWEPLTQETNSTNNTQNGTLSTEPEDDNRSFTLQKYVDKAGVYMENKRRRDENKTKAPSHYEKMESMPGIGTPKKR